MSIHTSTISKGEVAMARITRLIIAAALIGVALSISMTRVHAASPGTPDNPACNIQMTVCHWTETSGGPISDWQDCPTFTIDATYVATRQYTVFYDASGNPTRELRHISYTGILTNRTTGSSVPYVGDFNREFDYTTGVLRITGLETRIPLPGGGSMVLGAGYSLIDANGDVVSHGPSNSALLCSVLA
jgi:hypothetical protein